MERFWSKVKKTDTCWLWQSATCKGYGLFSYLGKEVYAHRFSYELLVGPIPEGMELDHLCRSPACVNPARLEPVTHQENCRRGEAGRHKCRRIHCKWGHEFTPENTYVDPRGDRHCRICRLAYQKEYKK